MSRVLVVYGTKTGSTSGIADQIGTTLTEMRDTATVLSTTDSPDPATYDAVIVGSGVRAGNWHGSVKKWVQANAETLQTVPTAFFTVGLTLQTDPDKTDEVRAYTDTLIMETGVQPMDIGLFKGMNDPKLFSMPERLILKALKAPQGDFREMDVVASWTRSVGPVLGLSK
ncbi:MAG: hypothetical protein PF636_11370 [Actinomycetota bacterium]|nr:hypothetical protein [Actinomycetota bacterium]